MSRKAGKELIHIQAWLERVDEITQRGEQAHLADALLQEAGDSLMMKLGEAIRLTTPARSARTGDTRATRGGVTAPHAW
jgi:hypothetical protein